MISARSSVQGLGFRVHLLCLLFPLLSMTIITTKRFLSPIEICLECCCCCCYCFLLFSGRLQQPMHIFHSNINNKNSANSSRNNGYNNSSNTYSSTNSSNNNSNNDNNTVVIQTHFTPGRCCRHVCAETWVKSCEDRQEPCPTRPGRPSDIVK